MRLEAPYQARPRGLSQNAGLLIDIWPSILIDLAKELVRRMEILSAGDRAHTEYKLIPNHVMYSQCD